MSMPATASIDPDLARRIDLAAIERLRMPGLLLMEHAALGVTAIVERMLSGRSRVAIACGTGGNGGDGWAAARLLHARGVASGLEVVVATLGTAAPGTDAAVNERIVRNLPDRGLRILDLSTTRDVGRFATLADESLVLDAMFGIGLARPIHGPAADLVEAITGLDGTPVVAVDVPSGLDARTGKPTGPCIRATTTATMVAPKTGMLVPGAARWTGRIEVVDIGIPASFLAEAGLVAGTAPVGDDAADPVSGPGPHRS